ncbi:electron transport complex subunit RsxC [Chitinibacter tainanensis]|uniref:electron transport complex subunit RsxC n=1 Tax=Chitinibacter tainanensis TaxID=230667 RepID=UPI000422AB82|nr:electron transport complex subunit RsxC [Chitinibacter tainanensis]
MFAKVFRAFKPFSSPQQLEFLTQANPHWHAEKNWRGGIKLPGNKQLTRNKAITRLRPGQALLRIPLGTQDPSTVQVHIGQRVLKQQALSHSDQVPWCHAPTSGHIVRIINGHNANGIPQLLVELQADGLDIGLPESVPPRPSREQLPQFLHEMGIVGMGGAGFSAGKKVSLLDDVRFLLINGVECEPYITADDRLMRERAMEIVRGLTQLAQIIQPRYIRIGIESNKPKAIQAMQLACQAASTAIDVVTVPTIYPAGSQQSLIKSLTNIQMQAGQHPNQHGILVLNVATLYAIGQALLYGQPLTHRVVTLTGDIQRPCNLEVPLGTTLSQLLHKVKPRNPQYRVWQGGPMMGSWQDDLSSVIGKTNSCIVIHSQAITPQAELPCIRCARCVDACPAQLQPVELYRAIQQQDQQRIQQHRLGACIECGACSSVCPSHIPLRDTFRQQKRR